MESNQCCSCYLCHAKNVFNASFLPTLMKIESTHNKQTCACAHKLNLIVFQFLIINLYSILTSSVDFI